MADKSTRSRVPKRPAPKPFHGEAAAAHVHDGAKVQEPAPKKEDPPIPPPVPPIMTLDEAKKAASHLLPQQTAPPVITSPVTSHSSFPRPHGIKITAEGARNLSQMGLQKQEEELRRKRTEETLARSKEIEEAFQHEFPIVCDKVYDAIRTTAAEGKRALRFPYAHKHAMYLLQRLGTELVTIGYTVQPVRFVTTLHEDDTPLCEVNISW